jgi:hypothetical protein
VARSLTTSNICNDVCSRAARGENKECLEGKSNAVVALSLLLKHS